MSVIPDCVKIPMLRSTLSIVFHSAVSHSVVVNSDLGVLKMENVSVLSCGKGSAVYVSMCQSQTVQSCVHTQIRHPASIQHTTLNWPHSGGTQIQ